MGTASTAAPERARWPRLTAAPRPRLRPLLAGGYAGFTEATVPRHLVLAATTSVPLVVKLLDSPHRPPAFVMGAHGSSTVVEGDCAPSYPEVLLAPLGAYTLLGLPRFRQQVGLRPKTAARLVRLDRVWRRLDERRPLDWGQVAADAGYADQAHLIRDFHQFTGTTPTRFQARSLAPGTGPG
jgi:hypothetical protein